MSLAHEALILLDPTVGHEQRGVRPCIVVSELEVVSDQRFPLLCIVPVTGTPGEGALYPELSPRRSGLAKRSYALIDHLRSVDKRRVRRVFGSIASKEMEVVNEKKSAGSRSKIVRNMGLFWRRDGVPLVGNKRDASGPRGRARRGQARRVCGFLEAGRNLCFLRRVSPLLEAAVSDLAGESNSA